MCLFLLSGLLFVQPAWARRPPLVYTHAGLAGGLELFDSSDIENEIGGRVIDPPGFPVSLVFRGGIGNVAQLEYRYQVLGSHEIQVEDIGRSFGARENIEYYSDDVLIKLNIIPRTYMREDAGLFFVFGKGDTEYRYASGRNWRGDSTLVGLELLALQRNVSFGFGFRVANIEFDRHADGELSGRTLSATNVTFDISIAFGSGIGLYW